MIVLAFDTSLAACSAAVVDASSDVSVLSSSYCEPGKGHAEILLDLVGEVMSKAGVDFEDIKYQIVTTGPGSFTGVRVALSAARGFRIAHDIPICGLSTLQAIAANISRLEGLAPLSPVAVIIDARRNQAYGQVFDATLKPLCAPALVAVDELGLWLKTWKELPLSIMGTGAGLMAGDNVSMCENWNVIHEFPNPDAACFAAVFADTKPEDEPPEPLYLRKPDAKPQIIGQVRA